MRSRLVHLAVVALAFFPTAFGRATRAGTVPALEPASHRSFFGKDYPHDIQPTAKIEKDFSHPYPEMQDDSTYDKDYIKDENSDGGEWQTQTQYDLLRTKLQRKTAEKKRSEEYKEQLKKKLADAKDEERQAESAAEDEEKKLTNLEKKRKDEAEARERAEEAADKLRKTQAAHNQTANSSGQAKAGGEAEAEDNSGDTDVDGASKKVEKELKDIEDCKKALEDAQAELKRLQEERIKAEKAELAARALEAERLAAEKAAKKEEDALNAQLKQQQDAYDSAKTVSDEESAELAKMEKDMKSAEENVYKLRHSSSDNGGVDGGGGVYRTERSSAVEPHARLAVVFSLFVIRALF